MGRKRTKEEAIERLEDLPTFDLPYHSKVPGIAHAANKVYEGGKTLAKGLVYLDPLNLLADDFITVPIPMIAIPAHESHLLSGSPSMQIYIRPGETIVPTGGNVRDFNEGLEESAAMQGKALSPTSKPKKKLTSYQRKYKKEFAKIAPKHKLKNGKWKKGGFKAAVKAAHRSCK